MASVNSTNGGSGTGGGGGGSNLDAQFDAILQRLEESALKKAERNADKSESQDQTSAIVNAARNQGQ